jgi:GH43 family beta-xylosidase
VLYRDGRVFVAYSASGSWTDDYAIGMLALTGDDPLDPACWMRRATPAFARCDARGVWGPGHNSFLRSPDGSEDWLVYHAIDQAGGGWGARSVRAQPFGWTADGQPDLGLPVTPHLPLPEPAGVAQPLRRPAAVAA